MFIRCFFIFIIFSFCICCNAGNIKKYNKKEIICKTVFPNELEKDLYNFDLYINELESNKRVSAKIIDWTVNNTDKLNGCSLTGWSKFGLDINYNPWYLKIGIISGRMECYKKIEIIDNKKWGCFEDWEMNHSQNVFFGICFIKEF